MRALLLLLLTGCVGAPDYYEVTPFYGTMDLGQRDIDAVESGLMFTLGWTPGEAAYHDRMEDYALASLAANPNVDPEWLQAIQDDAPEEDLDLSDFTDKPETLDAAYIFVIWVGAICLLLFTLKQVGILNRFLPSTTKPKDKAPE